MAVGSFATPFPSEKRADVGSQGPSFRGFRTGRGLLGGTYAHRSCSFGIRRRLNATQLNTNRQSTFASTRTFTFLSGPACFSQPNGFSASHRLLKLIGNVEGRVFAAVRA